MYQEKAVSELTKGKQIVREPAVSKEDIQGLVRETIHQEYHGVIQKSIENCFATGNTLSGPQYKKKSDKKRKESFIINKSTVLVLS